jgi:hypothetical protein
MKSCFKKYHISVPRQIGKASGSSQPPLQMPPNSSLDRSPQDRNINDCMDKKSSTSPAPRVQAGKAQLQKGKFRLCSRWGQTAAPGLVTVYVAAGCWVTKLLPPPATAAVAPATVQPGR